jgi:hypothetical protein
MAIKINNDTIIDNNKGIIDVNNSAGPVNSVLTSTGTTIEWKPFAETVAATKAIAYFYAATV